MCEHCDTSKANIAAVASMLRRTDKPSARAVQSYAYADKYLVPRPFYQSPDVRLENNAGFITAAGNTDITFTRPDVLVKTGLAPTKPLNAFLSLDSVTLLAFATGAFTAATYFGAVVYWIDTNNAKQYPIGSIGGNMNAATAVLNRDTPLIVPVSLFDDEASIGSIRVATFVYAAGGAAGIALACSINASVVYVVPNEYD